MDKVTLRLPWRLALILVAALPSLTWLEYVSFNAVGVELHGRFLVYASAAVVLTVGAGFALRKSPKPRRRAPLVLVLMGVWLMWLMFTALVGGAEPREWLPTLLRWLLYASTLVIGWTAVITYRGDRRALLASFLTAMAVSVAIPLSVAAAQLISGNVTILNNAPRVSGTMYGHPVALSLVLAVGVLFLWPIALWGTGRLRSVAIVVCVAAYVGIMLTFTRATMLLVPVAVAGLSLLIIGRRMTLRHAAAAVAGTGLVMVLTVPFSMARLSEDAPMPVLLPSQASDVPLASDTPELGPTGTDAGLPLDNSTGLRIETHLFGVTFIRESPIVGHGPGSFDRLFLEATGKELVAAHNDMLQTAVETGIVGLCLVLAVFGAMAVSGVRLVFRSSGAVRRFAASMAAAFVTINFASTIHNPAYFPEIQLPLWLAAGMALGLLDRD